MKINFVCVYLDWIHPALGRALVLGSVGTLGRGLGRGVALRGGGGGGGVSNSKKTVNRDMIKKDTITSYRVSKFNRAIFTVNRQTKEMISSSFIYHYFSCSSRTFGSQIIILTGKTVFMFPNNYTHFMVFST